MVWIKFQCLLITVQSIFIFTHLIKNHTFMIPIVRVLIHLLYTFLSWWIELLVIPRFSWALIYSRVWLDCNSFRGWIISFMYSFRTLFYNLQNGSLASTFFIFINLGFPIIDTTQFNFACFLTVKSWIFKWIKEVFTGFQTSNMR